MENLLERADENQLTQQILPYNQDSQEKNYIAIVEGVTKVDLRWM